MTVESKSKNSVKRTRLIVVAVVVIAAAVAAAFVLISNQSAGSTDAYDYSQIPQERQPDGGFVLGDPGAPVTIVAFEDFLCGHCQRYKAHVEKLISEYVAKGLARFEYRFTPVVDPSYSWQTAKLAECAESLRPGSFWNAHDALYEIASARQFSDNSSRIFAERMDMSYAELLTCTRDADQVNKDLQLANQLGVTGTPTVFVRYGDGFPQPFPFGKQPNFEQLATIIDGAS
ncbi:MAG: thioredoxin domain-containing protein [Chloroflexota bacterium]|nr:thioredoxin domain-containing protein [Chloroflexota bacterium]